VSVRQVISEKMRKKRLTPPKNAKNRAKKTSIPRKKVRWNDARDASQRISARHDASDHCGNNADERCENREKSRAQFEVGKHAPT